MKILILAYATGGGPSPDRQIQLCVYAPALTIILSWLLVRWKRPLVWAAVALAFIDSLVVIRSFADYVGSIMWLYPVKPWSLIVVPWIATAMPFLVIWKLYVSGKK
jgi:hypothetical protein